LFKGSPDVHVKETRKGREREVGQENQEEREGEGLREVKKEKRDGETHVENSSEKKGDSKKRGEGKEKKLILGRVRPATVHSKGAGQERRQRERRTGFLPEG